ncbi:hypothetical protein [Psychroserpens sp. SPM9]|uniref:hypothetical protein n=1 Tax=Psychroserpens sp. SPM9 TaxID=2975598 RepID=UPI0021A27755|nr:hypothetical protein [Psychroserpens sp. SPM9]MDG5491420.1 hypothetical protein [Psychroserpens sp. SPM9]
MKSFVLFLIGLVFSFSSKAQTATDFGVKGGLNLTFFKVTEANFGPRVQTETGYYGGIFVDFHVNDSFSFQPEILYIGLGEFKFLNAPLYAKYEMAHNLDILLGPSLNYFFDFFTNKFKIRGDVSSAYHITEALDVHIKYTLGFQEISPNGLFFGIGYRL